MKAIPPVTIPRDLTTARVRMDTMEKAQTALVSILMTSSQRGCGRSPGALTFSPWSPDTFFFAAWSTNIILL